MLNSIQTWRPHFFVLNGSKLYYTEETNVQDEDEDGYDDDATSIEVILRSFFKLIIS